MKLAHKKKTNRLYDLYVVLTDESFTHIHNVNVSWHSLTLMMFMSETEIELLFNYYYSAWKFGMKEKGPK